MRPQIIYQFFLLKHYSLLKTFLRWLWKMMRLSRLKEWTSQRLPASYFYRWQLLKTWQRSWRRLAPWSRNPVNCCVLFRPCSTSEPRRLPFQRRCCARARSATRAGNCENCFWWRAVLTFNKYCVVFVVYQSVYTDNELQKVFWNW